MDLFRPFRCKFCYSAKVSFDIFKQHQRRHNVKYINVWTRSRFRGTVYAQRIVTYQHKERSVLAKTKQRHHETSGESEMGRAFFQCHFCEKRFVGSRRRLTDHMESDHECKTFKVSSVSDKFCKQTGISSSQMSIILYQREN